MSPRWRGGIVLACCAAVAVIAAGCAFEAVRPELTVAPPRAYSTLVVGDVRVADATWEPLVAPFRKGLVKRLREEGVFETVVKTLPSPLGASTITLSGTITGVDRGNAALRFLVGMGAGQAKVKGAFEIADPRGETLVKFDARRSYLGGAGIGGASFVDMEELLARLGETVAETVTKWVKRELVE